MLMDTRKTQNNQHAKLAWGGNSEISRVGEHEVCQDAIDNGE